jgi:hypothetical protein
MLAGKFGGTQDEGRRKKEEGRRKKVEGKRGLSMLFGRIPYYQFPITNSLLPIPYYQFFNLKSKI